MPGQSRHLREVAHRGLTRVCLPVSVGREARRRVKCQVWRDRIKVLRVQRQDLLQPLDRIGDEQGDGAKEQ